MVELVVVGMQKADARMAGFAAPVVRSPAGEPVSVMHCEPLTPKALAVFWLGQKLPESGSRSRW
jgi:hypothetical protein